MSIRPIKECPGRNCRIYNITLIAKRLILFAERERNLMSSDLPLRGGCNCGAIRYELRTPPVAVAACHCENCRRQGGAAYSVNLVMPATSVSLTGEYSSFEDRGEDSGLPVVREFCGKCGSPIRSLPAATPSIVAIKAGTLDDPAPFPPTAHIWTCSKVAWVDIPEGVRSFDRGPPMR